MSNWHLGTIGFSYVDWVGEFYPSGTTQREYLVYYSKVFNSVEIDTTFHSIPKPSIIQSWHANSPRGFQFCLKTPRLITHELGLKGSQGIMEEFLEAFSPLKTKLGPVLIQMPPSYTQDQYQVLADFLGNLPSTFRYAIEFRHSSWYNERTSQLLAQYGVCWVMIDYPNFPIQVHHTADFLYLRWIGVNGMYQHHTHERVDKTERLKAWINIINPFVEQVSDVYGFFNNDYTGFAAGSCRRFMRLVGLEPNEPNVPLQQRLF